MSGSARAGTISREAYLRAVNPEALQCALSRARPGHLCFSVDKDLHGWSPIRTEPLHFRVLSGLPVIRSEHRERQSSLHLFAKSSGSGKDPELSRCAGHAQIAAFIWSEKPLGEYLFNAERH